MTPPRISVVPPAARTAGPQITRLAALAGIRLDQAQRAILDAFCGVAADGRWAAFEAAVLQSRQNGKTEVLLARILGGLFVLGEQEILFSAHQSRTTAAVFRRLKRAIEGAPELGGRIARVSNRIGGEVLELESGQRLECVARSTGTGRGFSAVPLLILDEAQYLTAAMMEDVLPTLAATPNGQILYALSRGTEESGHLGALRARALSRGPGDRVCWLEWSLAEGDRLDDPRVWAACNPALAAGRISMEYIRDELAALGPDGFARERLGRSSWPVDSTGRFAVVTAAAWHGCERPAAATEGGRVSLGAAASRLGESAAVVACAQSPGGPPVVELLSWRPSERGGWVALYLAQLAGRHRVHAVVWDDESPAREFGLTHVPGARTVNPKPGDYPRACMSFLETVEQGALAHLGQAQLTAAVGAATARNTSRGWYFSADPFAAEVLAAAVWALHGFQGNRCPYNLVASVA
jgi:hypothetical protein